MTRQLSGVLAAAPTPLERDGAIQLEAIPAVLDHLARTRCHGALLLGTTGEGPSLSVAERVSVISRAAAWRRDRALSDFLLLAGTGCASVTDTIEATRAAFDEGLDAVVVLPAFYYRAASAEGIAAYFTRVIEESVPDDGRLLAYHIPRVSGVAVPLSVVDTLRTRFPGRFAGLKDSGLDLDYTRELCRVDRNLTVFTGTDTHLVGALEAGGAGSITALANVSGGLARIVFDAYQAEDRAEPAQAALAKARGVLDDYPPVPAIKALLADICELPHWSVRLPMQDLGEDARAELVERMVIALADTQ